MLEKTTTKNRSLFNDPMQWRFTSLQVVGIKSSALIVMVIFLILSLHMERLNKSFPYDHSSLLFNLCRFLLLFISILCKIFKKKTADRSLKLKL